MSEEGGQDRKLVVHDESPLRVRRSDVANTFLGSLGAAGLVGLAGLLWTIVNSITANYTNAINVAEGRMDRRIDKVEARQERCCKGRY